ncbi:transcriptional regulator GutM [Streptococcus mutans]|uniref:transcriptional regulator GutM n=1 Tax=Streptococcus mutans TaxID=1309 RepID=UPI0002B5D1A0|nr:transcriptional regulator GutM [Streptococcus mutans]EMB78021.1 sorbitol operon activator [Streptococcus mutans 5SM3]MCB4979452.1 transcriptional regulator GutM [Streptococcus mutans]NLQ74164.1 transcriptional regulator [Streptococcus mutans]
MNFMIIFGLFALAAYAVQIILGLKQIKHFNSIYRQLRRLGRVAIGRRSGKIRAGTIVMFAIDKDSKVLAAKKMQGITMAARFKDMSDYIGQDIHYFDSYNPLIRKENKLLRIAIEDARAVFLKTEAGIYKESPKQTPLLDIRLQTKFLLSRFKLKKRHETKI